MSRRFSAEREVLRHLKLLVGRLDLDPTEPYIVGVSGGPDSAALLDALVQTGFEHLVPVYVDHGLRAEEEIGEDRRAVQLLCERLGVTPRFLPVNVEEGGVGGVEAAARLARRAALCSEADQHAAVGIWLAHHQDDNLETILLRLISGAGSQGLAGIRETAGRFLRPFLPLSGATVKEYTRVRKLPSVSDRMNLDVRYERARFRRFLRPVLEEHFPGYRSGIVRAAEKLFQDSAALNGQAERISWEPVGGPFGETGVGIYRTDLDGFLTAPGAVRLRSALMLVDRLGLVPEEHGVPYESVAPLAQDFVVHRGDGNEGRLGDGATGRRVACGTREFSFVIDGDSVRMEPAIVLGEQMGYLYVVCGEGIRSPVTGLAIRHVCQTIPRTTAGSVAWESSATGIRGVGLRTESVVIVRSPRPGDSIAVASGDQGRRGVRALLAKDGVPDRLRSLVPVVECDGRAAAIIAGPFGGKNRTEVKVPRFPEAREVVARQAGGGSRVRESGVEGRGARGSGAAERERLIEITVWFDGA